MGFAYAAFDPFSDGIGRNPVLAAFELEFVFMYKPSPVATAPRKLWTAPRLDKLGTIADVANFRAGNRQISNPVFTIGS
ncbi:MAG: hypothetical protein ABW194_00810 [Novosphingobium sp.]